MQVRSHVDGSLTASWKTSQLSQAAGLQVCKDACTNLGFTLRIKSLTPAGSPLQVLHFFTQETAEQGLLGSHGYRGAGEVVLDLQAVVPEAVALQDLQGMTVAQLRAYAEEQGISLPTRASKAQILSLLQPEQAVEPEQAQGEPESHPEAAALAALVDARLEAEAE